ncbi:hypothetical protein SAMN05428974_2478 [Sphingopyxis sp. YR583]|jgi:hypothetical protein|uniref:hypothetical protein n=1 Tax=Sphingopyxis sp. YR583 TaxID=1881047 RepID=UPI0008A80787|nr:hypothetical protein [Sphingopyxis sp. YR583]SEH18251.1 hypothetical protein SAMN05428974_2478 [Sphingopyxis sp. YR583]
MIIGRREALTLATGFAAASALGNCGEAQSASFGDGRTDATDKLLDIFAEMAVTGRSIPIAGVYKISRPIAIPPGIVVGDNVTFDFRGADPANFPGACLLVHGAVKRPLPGLLESLKIGDRRVAFKAAHKMTMGEAFQLSGTVDFAGNGYRPYYRKGEIFRVARVIDARTVEIEGACRDSYPASGVTCWHRPGSSFSQKCKTLRVLAPDNIQFAARFIGLDRSDISNVQAEGGSVAAIDILDCFEMAGKNLQARQRSNRFDGYGISIDACQSIRLSGMAHGYFNGIATGGGGKGTDGLIGMNRDIHFEGTASSDAKGGLAGANFHGNTEFSSYRGLFTNGVVLAGNHNEAHGEFIGKSGQSALIFSEMHGHSFLVTGRVRTTGADLPSNAGAINMGSSGDDYGRHARYGGRAIIDVSVDAPQASRIVLWRTTDLKRKDVALEFRRLELVRSHPKARFMVLSKVRGDALPLIQFGKWQVDDKAVPIKWSIDPGTQLQGLDRRRLTAA